MKSVDWIVKFVIFYFSETYFEIELVKKLEIKIEKQRNEIKKLEQSTIDYKTENEEVSIYFVFSDDKLQINIWIIYTNTISLRLQLRCQKEKVSACSRDIRRKLRHTQSQLNILVDERADLTSKVHRMKFVNISLRSLNSSDR